MFLGACDLHMQITSRAHPGIASSLFPQGVTTCWTTSLPDSAFKIGQTFRTKRTTFGMTNRPSRIGLDARYGTLRHAQPAVITRIGVDGKDPKKAVRLRKSTGRARILAAAATNANISQHSVAQCFSFLEILAIRNFETPIRLVLPPLAQDPSDGTQAGQLGIPHTQTQVRQPPC